VIGPEKGPALHTHLREDELWYVIDGDFRFKAAGEVPFCRWVMVVSCEKSAMAWNMLGPRMNRLGPL
jgi:uncharacterized cupin superfamily protein